MNKKATVRIVIFAIFVVFVLLFLFLRGSLPLELTKEQLAEIDVLVENRNQWAQYEALDHTFTTNCLYVTHSAEEHIVLTVCHRSKSDNGISYYGSASYEVMDGELIPIQMYQAEGYTKYTKVNLDILPDGMLRQTLRESYINWLIQ